MLIVEDVSTIEDRNDFLARGRIRLIETSTGKVVAEYLGFQSMVTKAVCPSARKYPPLPPNHAHARDMLPFFFDAALRPSDSALAAADRMEEVVVDFNDSAALPDGTEPQLAAVPVAISPRPERPGMPGRAMPKGTPPPAPAIAPPKYPAATQALPPAISSSPLPTFPPNTELHLMGVYKGVMPDGEKETVWWQKCDSYQKTIDRGGSGSYSPDRKEMLECHRQWAGYRDTKVIRVEVKRTVAPVVLTLMSYEPAVWKLKVAPGVRIERILLSGYHAQDIEGVPDSVSVDVRTYRASTCDVCQVKPGYFQAHDTVSKNYLETVQKLKTITGLEPKSFQGNYNAGFFVLDNRPY
jgi:hypothetical protein